MQLLGIVSGLMMIGSFLSSWWQEGVISKVHYFLGIMVYAVFPVSYKYAFLTVVTVLLYLLTIGLAKLKPFRVAALVFALACMFIAVVDIIEVYISKSGGYDISVGTGLWTFLGASAAALFACVMLLLRARKETLLEGGPAL